MDNFHLYQIVIVIISVSMIIQGISRYFRHEANQTFLKLFVRIIIWGSMSIVTLYPGISNTIAGFIGIEGNVNAVILTAFLFVFLMMFKLLSAIEKIESQMTELARKESLKEITRDRK